MRKCVVILLLISSLAYSQTKSFSSLSKYEKRWAFFHPFAAFRIKKHQGEMYVMYNDVQKNNLLDQYKNGGKLDAFRHTFSMAYFSRFVCARKLRRLGKLHEKGNHLQFKRNIEEDGELPDSVSCVMDIWNNAVGLTIGKEFKKVPIEELKQKVIEIIRKGSAFIVKRNEFGAYVDCKGDPVPEKKKGTWGIPKCLVGSN